jgi:UDP-N-acetylglucosamine:LPS N-acetylglucosamine transferase
MKIILTGGGTGGHFYPIIAVAEKLNQIAKDNRLLKPELFYMSTDPYDENLLFENSITFYKVSAGKIRRDKTPENLLKNFFDLFKTFLGVLSALWRVFVIYPDVVFGKGGYASFPVLFAARVMEEIANYRAHVMTVAQNQAAQVIETERKRVHLFQANADMWRERAERTEAHERMIRDQMEHMQRRLNEANVAHDSMRVQAEHYRAQIEE